jgi:hypothetical protein
MSFRPLPAKAGAALLRELKPLKNLSTQAQRLAQLQQVLQSQLQPAAREHCQVASWRQGCLLLIVSDAHWATRLRYQQRRLLRQLQTLETFSSLNKILFKVQPKAITKPATGTPYTLSDSAADSLQAAADTVNDPRLRAALQRLAEHRHSGA